MAMRSLPFRESESFLRGRRGEQIVKRWLQKRGWYIIDSYDYCGVDGDKAPRMQSITSRLVIPDLDIAKDGIRRWAEVKAKYQPLTWRKTGELQHGIDLRHYNDYRQVQRITGAHVWLFIVEEKTQLILAESLDKLGSPRIGKQYGKGGMVNWAREKFKIRVPIHAVPNLFRN